MSTGFNFTITNSAPVLVFLDVDKDNNNCLDVDFITPNPFLGQQYLLGPGESLKTRLFRKDGHGCDGRQGEFQISPTFIVNNAKVTHAYQQFSFDSNGGIAAVGTPPTFGSVLTQAGAGSDATWTLSI
ncbi:hypothetical protein [Sphingomonas sp.]|jgi:hypothetical protein|uniref:hypothetical protein n=1 Tax=Sphingomonas sp. TaxID=28214 RepID=UPI002E30086E|nr:hypothetical protein [Sphingomonas sp.]HEX4694894.1 hypothetical protein [Sphingomonas sp.]